MLQFAENLHGGNTFIVQATEQILSQWQLPKQPNILGGV
jgi:hypothetical protein